MYIQEGLKKIDIHKPSLVTTMDLIFKMENQLPSSYDELNRALRQPDVKLSDLADKIFGGE